MGWQDGGLDIIRGFQMGQEARNYWDDRHNRRAAREAEMAQRGALRSEFGDRSGGNVEDVTSLNNVDENLAERRRGAQQAGLGIVEQILSAPPESQRQLAETYAPALAQAFGVQPDQVFAGLEAIQSSPDPRAAVAALRGSFGDPALNALVGAPNLRNRETGDAAAMTRDGRIITAPGYDLSTSYNTDTRVQEDALRRRSPSPQAGVRYDGLDEEGIPTTAAILPGTPQETTNAAAEAELESALTDAQAPDIARQRLTDELTNMGNRYVQLWQEGGAVDSQDPNTLRRIRNMAEATPVGRIISRMGGSQLESLRQEITNARDRLLPAIMQAEDAGARMFDSNAEREGFLRALSDPGQDIYAALASIDQISRRLGSGGVADIIDLPAALASGMRPNVGGDRRPVTREERTPPPAPAAAPAAPTDGRSRDDSLDAIRERLRARRQQ